MANVVYPEYKQSLLAGDANTALTGTGATGLYVALVDTGTYTYSAAHQFYSDLSGVIGTDQEIGSVTTANGLVDGDAVTWTAVSGNSAEALVFYRKNAGANTTWRLVAYIDSGQTGMAVTPNGGDITYTPSASGIFQL
jgi:hypothetical protein